MYLVPYKLKQFLAPLIKITVVAACIYMLYLQWSDKPLSIDTLLEKLEKLPWLTLPLMFIISLVSWLVESKKWQYLLDDFYELRFRESVLQNLTAQAASFITPFRVGEFAMKSLFFKKDLRKTVLTRILAGNISQMIITTALGLIGLFLFLKENLEFETGFLFISTAVLILLLAVFTALWIIKKWNTTRMSSRLWITTILYSFLRYTIFASNWLLILWLLDYEVSFLIIIRNIMVFYLVVSIVPIFQIFDVALKWSVAAFVFKGSTFNIDGILIATTLIWITNSLFPTLLGCALLPFQKLKTTAG